MRTLLLFLLSLICSLTCARDPFVLPTPIQSKPLLISLHYLNAEKVAALIRNKTAKLLSLNGHIIVISERNQLWIRDEPSHVKEIAHFISATDKPNPQILIKAKILLLDESSLQTLGIHLHVSPQTNQSSIPLIEFTNHTLLQVQLNALAEQGHAIILSAPTLITNNRKTAHIESGEEIPYQQQENYGNTSTSFKKAVLSLRVTPTLLPDNKITLSLQINQDKPSDLYINGSPAITTEQLETTVTVKNQQTLVLGGIYEQSTSQRDTHVPWVSKIPLLGFLFKSTQKESNKKQLVILITPSLLL